jgi:predicted nucleotidyltransferase
MLLAQEPTPYKELNAVMLEMVKSMQVVLENNLVGVYLQGSFAVGGFDRHSDLDFIVVINEAISDSQLQDLQEMHSRLYQLESKWAQHLEGTYFPADILRDHKQLGERLWYLDNGSQALELSDHCNTVVVRWTVRSHGVRLVGPSPVRLVNPIPVRALRRDIFAVINDWGQEILAEPERYNNRFYQSFIVLNFCRMLHDLHSGRTGSKAAGAAWVKETLDPTWAGLIDRSWSGRPNPAISVRTPADPAEFQSTLAFLQYIIEESNQYYGDKQGDNAGGR